MQSLLILGRQPAIGLAEVESLYGAAKLQPIGKQAVMVDVDPCLLAFDRLGGSIKFAKVLAELPTTNWADLQQFLLEQGPTHSTSMPPGKMHLGISAYGFNLSPKQIHQSAINLKQAIRTTGRSVRVVPNNSSELSSAQVIHNQLTSPNGWELLLIQNGNSTIIAQTVKVQDIAAYAKRDQQRPFRDPKVGMLPPKLAQVIVNLATGLLPKEASQSICEIPPDQPIPKTHYTNSLLLDPFCGTGVIIQEASVMGYDSTGSDIEPRLVDYSKRNLEWLKHLPRSPLSPKVNLDFMTADATSFIWPKQPTFIASEIFLGPPLSKPPSELELSQLKREVSQLLKRFLDNLAPQIKPQTRLCLAVPAWQAQNGDISHLPSLDSIGVVGYNRVSFKHSRDDDLIYFRPNQIVARELLVLTRK